MLGLKTYESNMLEGLLRMKDGYVLNFSDRTLQTFVKESVGVDINDNKYCVDGISKAKRLRCFFNTEPKYVATKLLDALVRYGELNNLLDQTLYKKCLEIIEFLKKVDSVLEIDVLTKIDSIHIDEFIEKIKKRLSENDLAGAITASRSLLETVFRFILGEHDTLINSSEKGDLGKLLKAVSKKLHFDTVNTQSMKQIIAGLSSLINGLSTMSNDSGDRHGKDRNHLRPAFQYAQLYAKLAILVSEFVYEEYNKKGIS